VGRPAGSEQPSRRPCRAGGEISSGKGSEERVPVRHPLCGALSPDDGAKGVDGPPGAGSPGLDGCGPPGSAVVCVRIVERTVGWPRAVATV